MGESSETERLKSVVSIMNLIKTQAAVLVNSLDLKQATFFQVTCVQDIMFWGFTNNFFTLSEKQESAFA